MLKLQAHKHTPAHMSAHMSSFTYHNMFVVCGMTLLPTSRYRVNKLSGWIPQAVNISTGREYE